MLDSPVFWVHIIGRTRIGNTTAVRIGWREIIAVEIPSECHSLMKSDACLSKPSFVRSDVDGCDHIAKAWPSDACTTVYLMNNLALIFIETLSIIELWQRVSLTGSSSLEHADSPFSQTEPPGLPSNQGMVGRSRHDGIGPINPDNRFDSPGTL
jgi:hypothetical protein